MERETPWARVQVGPDSFSVPVNFGGTMWVRARAASSEKVPAWFRAVWGTNLVKRGGNITGRLSGFVAQWYSARILGSSPCRAWFSFRTCEFLFVLW